MSHLSEVTQSNGSRNMICVECFRTKGDGDLKLPCQNPKCYFYCYSTSLPSFSGGDDVFSSAISTSSFNKEVGHDRKSKFFSNPRKASDYLGTCSPPQVSGKDKMWRNDTLVPSLMNAPHVMEKASHSKSASISGGSTNIQRLLSGQAPLYIKERGKPNYYRSRMMSLPDCADSYLEREEGRDLVEDTFVPSPVLADYSEARDGKHHFRPPDIGSHFGRSAAVMDLMDYPTSKACSMPITSALPTVSSSSRTTDAFDMTQLKMEMTKAISSKLEQSLTVSGKVSPDFMNPSDISTLLGLGGLAQCSETYSRKVFVGGLPPEVDEDDIKIFFMHFGSLTVDWPHKNHSRACIPPKGYAFLLFKFESSVHKLLLSCKPEGEKHFIYMPTPNLAKKKVQVRPWYIADSYHCLDASKPVDPRKAVFVGGVPRPLKASELAEVMTLKYGNVALIMIDSDCDLKYPKGAACVVFSSHASYIAAVSARFMQLCYGSLDKKIEIKPYVLDGQMCDECTGVQCAGKPAPFFCGSVTCLQYYCEYCWATVHSMPGRQNHRPLLKDIGDKARFY